MTTEATITAVVASIPHEAVDSLEPGKHFVIGDYNHDWLMEIHVFRVEEDGSFKEFSRMDDEWLPEGGLFIDGLDDEDSTSVILGVFDSFTEAVKHIVTEECDWDAKEEHLGEAKEWLECL